MDAQKRVFVPPTALKNTLTEVARFLSETVKGKGKATWTKHFEAGIMVTDPLILLGADGQPIRPETVIGEKVFVPSNGERGGGSRVWKTFPIIPEWRTSATIILFDPMLIDNPAKVEEYLRHAGKFIGFLRFRPRNGGYYGRFEIRNFKAGAKTEAQQPVEEETEDEGQEVVAVGK